MKTLLDFHQEEGYNQFSPTLLVVVIEGTRVCLSGLRVSFLFAKFFVDFLIEPLGFRFVLLP